MSEQKRTVSDIVIDRILKDVDEKGYMPWQRPYKCYNAFNYFSMTPYRGINRIMLEFGEYMTALQVNQYNKSHGEDFKFQKGIKWYPVVFFKEDKRPVSEDEVNKLFPDWVQVDPRDVYIGIKDGWTYMKNGDSSSYYKRRNILRYSNVAERRYFKNSKGELLPSRIETGEAVLSLSKPKDVYDSYIARSGVFVEENYAGVPCYSPMVDTVYLNPHTKNESTWYSTAFHELAHSTGAKSRLNRIGITHEGMDSAKKDEVYAIEECIAEITASLLCGECGVDGFVTSETTLYDNTVAYVQSWKKRIKDFGKEFIYIASQADKAFNYIMNEDI